MQQFDTNSGFLPSKEFTGKAKITMRFRLEVQT